MAFTVGATDVALITTSTNPVLQSGGTQSIVFLKASVCNTDSGQHLVTLWRNAATTAADMIWDAQPIPAGATVVIPLSGQTLPPGAGLYAIQDSGSGVNLNIGWVAQ